MNNINVNMYAYFDNKQKFVYDYETYDCDVLFILEKGEFTYINETGDCITVCEGNIVYCPKGFTFRRTVIKSVYLHIIRFTCDGQEYKTTKKYFINKRMKDDLERLKSLLWKSNILDESKIHYCTDFIREVFFEQENNKIPDVLCKILDYIDKNISRTINNDELCKISFLSEPSVISLMKKHLHKTPNEYINSLRIAIAQRLLIETDDSVKNISLSVGFKDSLYFSKVFKKMVGITPTHFRSMCSL